MITIEKIRVDYLNEVVEIRDVLLKGLKQTRYWIRNTGFLSGKYGTRYFNLLWHQYKLWLQSRKLDAIKTRLKIRDFIINALPMLKIKKLDRIELVDLDRKFRII